MSRGQNAARMPRNFVCTVVQHVPATEVKFQPIRNNDQDIELNPSSKNKHTRVGIKTSINKKKTVEFKCKKRQLILITKEENKLGIKTHAHGTDSSVLVHREKQRM